MRPMISLIVGVIALLTAATVPAVTLTRNTVVPPEYFGLHIHKLVVPYSGTQINTPWPLAPFKAWRLLNAHVRWADIEPAQDTWDFSVMDASVAAALDHGIELTYNLGSTPRWASARPDEPCPHGFGCVAEPADLDDWDDYVRTVANRYKGKIRHYELWNEPSFTDNETVIAGWSGDVATLVELGVRAKAILAEVDPQAKLLAPAVTSHKRLETFLKAGGAAVADIVSFHFYNAYPEQIPNLLHNVRQWMAWAQIADRPLWNTEIGYVIGGSDGKGGTLTETTAASYTARSLVLGAAGGMARTHWHSYDGGTLGLSTDYGAVLNAPGRAYSTTYRWLVGALLKDCANDPNDGARWTCTLTRGSRKAWVMWRTDTVKAWKPPSKWGVRALEPLDGPQVTVSSGASVQIGTAPVLLKADTNPWQP